MNSFIVALVLLSTFIAVSECSYGAGYGRPKYSLFKYQAAHIVKGGCPYGWHTYNKRCYYFSRDKLTWYQASMKCASMGGYLVTVDQSHENTYIRHQLTVFRYRRGCWMALNDVLYPSKHRWCWGFAEKPCHKYDWYGQEPLYHTTGDYHCGCFWRSYQYHWHVDSCQQRNHYVCEMNLAKPCKCVY